MKLREKITPFTIFIFLYSIFGIVFLFQYGVPLDELTQRYIGIINSKFIAGTADIPTLEEHGFFGPAFESLAYLLEQLIYNSDIYYKILLRHFLLFFFFVLSVIAFFKIAIVAFKSHRISLATTIIYACHPIVFAHAFFNTKDTFFMCLLVYAFYFILQFISIPKLKYLILSACFLGIACTVRISGAFMALAVAIAIVVSGISEKRKYLRFLFFFFGISIAAYFVFFPYLWVHPLQSIEKLIHYSANNPWPWNTLAAGKEIVAGNLPWWYLFVWLGVGIPLLSIVFMVLGFFFSFRKENFRQPVWIITTLLFILPISYFVIGRPTIYNGWRHMQFLHLPISLFCGYGLLCIAEKWQNTAAIAVSAYSIFCLCIWQPYGYAYFNEAYSLFGKGNTYDQDYWGLSALPALKVLNAQDSGKIRVWCNTESAEQNALFMNENLRKRFEFVKQKEHADYLVWMQRNGLHIQADQKLIYSLCPSKDTLVWLVDRRE